MLTLENFIGATKSQEIASPDNRLQTAYKVEETKKKYRHKKR